MSQEQEKTSDTQLENLNKQKQDLEKQINDLKVQVLDEAKKAELKKLEEELEKIKAEIIKSSTQDQNNLKQDVEKFNHSNQKTFEIIKQTWLYTKLQDTFQDASIYPDLNWNIEAKIERFSDQINTTVQKYLESIFLPIWERQFPSAALTAMNTWIQFILMDWLKNSGDSSQFFSSIGNINLSWFKSLFEWLTKTIGKWWEFLSKWKKITKTIDFLSLQTSLRDNADKLPQLMNPYKFIQLINDPKLQSATDISTLSLSNLSIQEWDTTMTQVEQDALKKIAEDSAIKNNPQTIKAIISSLEKAQWFLEKRKDLANGALDLMDKANWMFAPFEKMLWINMFDMLKPFKWILNMVLSLLWFAGWLDWLQKKRLSRKIEKQLDTQEKKDFISDSMSYFKDNISKSSVKETDSGSILTLYGSAIGSISDDIKSKIPLDYNVICDSIKNNLINPEIINPVLLQQMWSPRSTMTVETVDANWTKTYKIDKDQFAGKENDFIKTYTNLTIPRLINDEKFMKDIDWQDEFWLAIIWWVVIDQKNIIDWIQSKAIIPSQYLITSKPQIGVEGPKLPEKENINQEELLKTINTQLQKYNSPIKAEEVRSTSTKYNVPPGYLMAFMKNDSSYGTAGVWARTRNPWNVWNTDDGSTKTFDTRQAWVDAVWDILKTRIDEYQNVYWDRFPTAKELADNIWPDGKWFLSRQWNYLKDNASRLWAYMTNPEWWNSVANISQELVNSGLSNVSQFEQIA